MFNYLPEEIINTRPLIFLCGPYFDEQDTRDRRNILRLSLGNVELKIDDVSIAPFALIVDNLFSTKQDPLPDSIKLSLLEEIIASCAYRNYVFVDTMSTALELGLFSSSYSQNSATAFLPSDYKLFKPSIGEFFEQTMEGSSKISKCVYAGKRVNKYDKDAKGVPYKVHTNLIGFNGKNLPKAIQKQIKNDFPADIDRFAIKIDFSDQMTDTSKIVFHIRDNNITFVVPPMILLYLVYRYKKIDVIQKILFKYFFHHYLKRYGNDKSLLILYRRGYLKSHIDTPFKERPEIVVNHFTYLINKISQSGPNKYKNLDYASRGLIWQNDYISFLDLFCLSTSKQHEMNSLALMMGRATRRKHITINGKSRKITMYAGTHMGFQLRGLNTKIKNTLESLLEIHPNAFAYRKNHSTLQCVQQHISSSFFLKIDIHDFFGSISKQVMKQLLKIQLSSNKEIIFEEWKAFRRHAKQKKYRFPRNMRHSVLVDNWTGLTAIMNLCFVNGHLPLGLTSSPFLSNVYMYFFDNCISKKYPSLVYTRYSDDMLISSQNEFDYEEVYNAIKVELEDLNLTINEEKTQRLHLSDKGDHVKFLGLNIIRDDGKNFVSVGKQYIKDTCLLFSQAQRASQFSRKCSPEISGKIKYIRYVREQDYQYLKKLYEIKVHEKADIIDELF